MIEGLELLSIISSVINNSTRELTVHKQLHITICNTLMSAGDSTVIVNITKVLIIIIHFQPQRFIFWLLYNGYC
jgi:hypothetical protein